MKTPNKAEQRADLMAANIETIRPRFGAETPLPSPEIVRRALVESLNSRTGRLLANAPTIAKKPLGHVFHKLFTWHGSGGNLWGIAMLGWQCEDVVKTLGLDITGRELQDQLDTLAIVSRGGKSSASAAWRAALGE
tara:strand:+ start:2092 stop:2499 length:408 start_codon:yes stop_codon:yes gene_type:complete